MASLLPVPDQDHRDDADLGAHLDDIPLVRPRVADPQAVADDVARILESGVLTNGPYVRQLEERAAEYLHVRHCIAVASCTSGLMLLLRAASLTGDVVTPSFTFAATTHAIAWAGLRPVFADVESSRLTLSPRSVRRMIGVRTSAILATHIFGAPCEIEELEDLAAQNGIRLFFDAAHAFGSRRMEVPIGGFGHAEVFSLSPTKVLLSGEGGIIATNDDELAERCRVGRDYGNPGDYDCRFVGLNARMSELHAAVALHSLSDLEQRIERRNDLAAKYRESLAEVPGLSFLEPRKGDRSTYKDLTIRVDPTDFGLDADALGEALDAVGIETRRYYSPPVHRMQAYRWLREADGTLPITEAAAEQTLTLPLWADMTDEHVWRVADAIYRVQRYRGHELDRGPRSSS